MKLRIHGNSVRLRLRKSEVARFGVEGKIGEQLEVGSGSLGYELIAADVPAVEADFVRGIILIRVPRQVATSWCASDEVGIYEKTQSVEVILEKEFRRTSASSPFDEDLYPNPRAGKHLQQIGGID